MKSNGVVMSEKTSMAWPVVYAMLLNAANGLTLGFYVLTYVVLIKLAFQNEHFQTENVGSLASMGFVAGLFILEYFLEVWAGAFAQRFGTRVAMFFSYAVKAAFFFGLIGIATFSPAMSPVLFWACFSLSGICFALHFTLFSGNYEIWLQEISGGGRLADRYFGGAEAFRYFFMFVGASIAVLTIGNVPMKDFLLLKSGAVQCYYYGAGACVLVAILALWVPGETRQESVQVDPSIGEDSTPAPASSSSSKFDAKKMIHDSKREFWSSKELVSLFSIAAMTYGVLQLVMTLLPFAILLAPSTTFEVFLVLVVGTYAPATVGSLVAAFLRTKSSQSRSNAACRPRQKAERLLEIYFGSMAMLVAGVAIGGAVAMPGSLAGMGNAKTVALLVGISVFRCSHSFADPRLKSLLSQIAEHASYPKVVFSKGEQLKKIGAIGVFAVAMIFATFELTPRNLVAISIVSISIATAVITSAITKRLLNDQVRAEHN